MIKTYYLLTKPGIIMGNAITAVAGFLLASKGTVDLLLLLKTVVGLSFVIASACVFNNYVDRDLDEKMERTKQRALVTGVISGQTACLFAALLGCLGFSLLLYATNLLAVSVAFTAFFIYVVLYGFWKRRKTIATLVGSVAGAFPPVVGYVAVSNHIDMGAWLLFSILVLWQMPHFFAIAMYRLEDYKAASVAVLPVVKGIYATKVQMLLYIASFLIATSMLTFCGYTGYRYLLTMLLLGAAWLYMSLQGFKAVNDTLWARRMFLFSLVVITVLSLMISID
jgi:heme o synthase